MPGGNTRAKEEAGTAWRPLDGGRRCVWGQCSRGTPVLGATARPRWGVDRAAQHGAPGAAPAKCGPVSHVSSPPAHLSQSTKVSQDPTLSPTHGWAARLACPLFWRPGGGARVTAASPAPAGASRQQAGGAPLPTTASASLGGSSSSAAWRGRHVGAGQWGPGAAQPSPGAGGHASSAAVCSRHLCARPPPALLPGDGLSSLGGARMPCGPGGPFAQCWGTLPGPHDHGKDQGRVHPSAPQGRPRNAVRAAAPTHTHTHTHSDAEAAQRGADFSCSKGASQPLHVQESTMLSPNRGSPPHCRIH